MTEKVNPGNQDAAVYAAMRVGFRVDRDASTLPQTGAVELFDVANGRVLASFLGEVTVVIQTQANGTQLVHNPAAGASVDLCADLSITADPVGTLYTLTGTAGDAMVGGGQAGPFGHPIVLGEGGIDLDCAANNTGEIKWTCWYVPLDDGAVVTAS